MKTELEEIRSVVMLPGSPHKDYRNAEGMLVKCTRKPPYSEEINVGVLTMCKNSSAGILEYWQPQHLYIISNEQVRNEDIDKEVLVFVSNLSSMHCLAGKGRGRVKGIGTYHKIISSTDTLLGLPLIPEWFIIEYAKRQGNIDKAPFVESWDDIFDLFHEQHFGSADQNDYFPDFKKWLKQNYNLPTKL